MLTGNTSLEAVLPLLSQYLATIPAAEGRGGRLDPRELTPLPFRFPEAPVVQDVEVGVGVELGGRGEGGERGEGVHVERRLWCRMWIWLWVWGWVGGGRGGGSWP